ncbi:MAG: LPS export ABC transporter periplasmic protein LptC [Coleofasciculaceae cyanobacterium]
MQRLLTFLFATFLTPILLSACNNTSDKQNKVQKNTPETEIEASLVFKNVTLDRADEKGNPLWKVKAKQASYAQDKKIARVESPKGDLFQDGKVILQVSADSGEILEDGDKVLLTGKVTATDLRNGAILKGDELEWRPREYLLVIRNNLQGKHPQLQASAKEGRYFTKKQQMDLVGQVEAISKDPDLQMKTEHLLWLLPEKKLVADQRTKMERYKEGKVTDRVEADRAEFNQNTKVVTLNQNVQLTSLAPPLLMSSNSVIWNLKTETAVSNQPVKIVDQKENLVFTGNQGQIDLEQEIASLTNGAQAINGKNQAKLYANNLSWNIPTEDIQASGNVTYQQVDPPWTTTGSTAKGKLKDQSVVVSGDAGKPVVTTIIP